MNKMILLGALVISLQVGSALANASEQLQSRLSKINSFYTNFSQKVTSAEGELIQQGEGELWVQRPNLFNWNMKAPDQSVLISDGKDLWFYNPFVEQVTVTSLQDATSDTPFMLITSNNPQNWKQYSVTQKGDNFDLKPHKANGTLKGFSITVTENGTIEKFSAVEQDGQTSAYQLKNLQSIAIDKKQFILSIPKGVTLDDQRSSK